MKRFALISVLLLVMTLSIAPGSAQTLSDQVLLLLSRVNSWTAAQTFTDVTITGTCTGCGGAGGGTVTSVAQSLDTELDAILDIGGTPITGSGTLALTMNTQTDHEFLAGAVSGGPSKPAFRAIVDDDIPDTITIGGTNNVTWASVNKTGSALADLATKSASSLDSGSLALARLTDGATAGVPLVAGGSGGDPNYAALDLTSATSISGQLAAANVPAFTGGDVTSAGGSLTLTLANSGVTATTYGGAAVIPQIAVDAKGRITSASDVAIGTANLLSTTFCADCSADAATRGSILYGNASNAWDELVLGTTGQALFSDGTDIAWGVDGTGLNIDVDNATAGTLALARGGSAKAITAVAGGVLYTDANSFEVTAAGTTGQCLLSNGASAPSWGSCATLASHNLLSATHGDTSAATVSRGSIVYGNSSPAWAELVIGSSGTFLRSDGTDISWSSNGSGITQLSASNLATGTVPLARLSGITTSQLSASAAVEWTQMESSGTSAELFATITDEAARSGGVVPQFVDWTDVAFSAGNFTGNASMTWTVGSGDQNIFQYTITGNKMTVAFDIATTTVGGTPDSTLQITIPGSVTVATKTGGAWIQPCWRIDNGTQLNTVCSVDSAGTTINVFADETTGSSTWTASTNNTRVSGILTFEIE